LDPIFETCVFWDETNCLSDRLKNLYQEHKSKKTKFVQPRGKKLKELNEICKKCSRPLYIEILKKESALYVEAGISRLKE